MSLIESTMRPSFAFSAPYSGECLQVNNPATETPIAEVELCNASVIPELLKAAEEGHISTGALTVQQRSQHLMAWYELVRAHKAELALLITREQGKPLAESEGEVDYAAGYIKWYAEQAIRSEGHILSSHTSDHDLCVIKQGVGIVLGITPWNFPLAMITRKVAPAYAAGCSFILKPSELTPLSALVLARLAYQAGISKQAFQVLVCSTEQTQSYMELLCASQHIRKLSFTGSTRVGERLYAQCSSTIKRLSLELGGNAPFIVCASADLSSAVKGLVLAKFRNAGQTCVAANRILVDKRIAREFKALLVEHVSTLKVGNGEEAGVQIGPLITPLAKSKANSLLESALQDGASVVWQGEIHNGAFMSPVIVEKVTAQMALYQQEVFAPIISIVEFEDEAELLKLANGTSAGLASYLYSQDRRQIRRLSRALEFGMVGINEAAISNPIAPFGGIKASGIGREGGAEGLLDYQVLKYLCESFD